MYVSMPISSNLNPLKIYDLLPKKKKLYATLYVKRSGNVFFVIKNTEH